MTPTSFRGTTTSGPLYTEFARIQEAAELRLPCGKEHKHTRHCHVYGFHDLRRAFATQNAPRLTADTLQKLMRHKSYATTQRYINMASQLDEAVASLHVPEVLKTGSANEASAMGRASPADCRCRSSVAARAAGQAGLIPE